MSGEFTAQTEVLSPLVHGETAGSAMEPDHSLLDVLTAIIKSRENGEALDDVAVAMRQSFPVDAVAVARIAGDRLTYIGHSLPHTLDSATVERERSVFAHLQDDDTIIDVQDTAERRLFASVERQDLAAHLIPVTATDRGNVAIAVFGSRAKLETPGVREKILAVGLILTDRFHTAAQVASERRHLDRLIKLQNMTARIIRHDGLVDDGQDILEDIARVFGYDAVRLGLINSHEIGFYQTYRAAVKRQPPDCAVPLNAGLVSEVIRTGVPQLVNASQIQDDHTSYDFPVRQMIYVPLRINGEISGVLTAASSGSRTLVVDDLGTLMMLAESIGLVIANFRRLYEVERRNHQLRLVDSLVTLIAERAMIQRAIPEVAREIANRFAFQLVSIGLIHGERIDFTVASVHVPMPPIKGFTGNFKIDQGVAGRVIRTGKAELIDDVRNDPDYVDTGRNARSEICVPIRADGQIIGVLNVETGADHPLDEADLEVLKIIARHLGIAFENEALLISERETRTAVEAIQQVSTIVTSTLDVDEALRRIVDTLGSHFDYRYVIAGLTEGQFVQPKAAHGIALERLVRIPTHSSDIGNVARTGRRIFISDLSRRRETYLDAFPDADSLIATPITRDGKILGVLIVIGSRDRALTRRDATMLQMFAQHAGVVLDNARMYEEARRMAYIDPMTQLPNHRHFQERFMTEFGRAQLDNRPLAVLVLDLDGFKETNDRFGHLEGDAVLTAAGQRFAGKLRESDLLARYAGDEFVALLPNTDAEAAMQIGERLCAAIGDEPFPISSGETTRLTASVGVAIYPDHGRSTRDLLIAADRAMYIAKRAESSQVRLAQAAHD